MGSVGLTFILKKSKQTNQTQRQKLSSFSNMASQSLFRLQFSLLSYQNCPNTYHNFTYFPFLIFLYKRFTIYIYRRAQHTAFISVWAFDSATNSPIWGVSEQAVSPTAWPVQPPRQYGRVPANNRTGSVPFQVAFDCSFVPYLISQDGSVELFLWHTFPPTAN